MACEECRELNAHEFRTPEDLVNAVRVAALEMDRGVLERVGGGERALREQESLESALASGELPAALDYRFRCRVCGDLFRLEADTRDATGTWTRQSRSGC